MPLFSSLFSLTRSALLSCLAASACTVNAAEEINFNRDIRPILSDKCNYCHGPDEGTREAGLRLDVREEAESVLESGELIDRIRSTDEDVVMPPPHSKLSLSAQEKDLLEAWIDDGAVYEAHWAFQRLPDSVPLPTVAAVDWCRQDLDRFVLAGLESAELDPASEASHLRWLRRVTLDLTGLPTTLEDIREFRASCDDDSEKAYGVAVDRLLASESFGEHMAVGWLDLARYADSYGYQSDKLNTQWPYRDWVVRVFNDNLPYDQFLTRQIAGDLLEDPTRDQLLATAFNRIHRLNNEGGAVFEEWRIENVADRVHTFGTAVLGLTMECCRCHDHKYDPISMREYYSLSAFFNSIDESGVYDRTEKVPCPSLLLPTKAQEQELAAALGKLAAAEEHCARAVAGASERWQDWKPAIEGVFPISDLRVALSFDRTFDNSLKEIYHPSEGDRSWAAMLPLVPIEKINIPRMPMGEASDLAVPESKSESKSESVADFGDGAKADSANVSESPRQALALDGERGVTVHGIEPLDRWTPFSVVVTLRETKRVSERSLIAHHTRGTDCGYNGWDLTVVDGHLESRMHRVWPGNAIGVRTREKIPVDQWVQLTATYDGSSRANGLRLYLNGRLLKTEVLRDDMKKSANVKVDHGGDFVVGHRFRARGLAGGQIDDVRLYLRALTPPELRFLATGKMMPTAEYYASAIDPKCREAFDELNEARHHVVLAEEVMNEIPIMSETTSPRETHVLSRGLYDAPTSEKTRVQREVPQELSLPFPEGQTRDRLGLARWVTDPSHPLTSRVAVNHLWGRFFAEPLVRTPENFGLQGELPTHPALLDWLARDFIRHGWNVKRLCRQIVLSATYRQDSVAAANRLQVDPENRLLSRGPSYRYSAEQIRDLVLASSGLINDQLGGPPVSPYQPGEDLWKESNGMSPPYQQSVGTSLYRRSLYSVWKRTVPLPNMMAFDSTTREVCTVARSRTNTPLQALVLLNDVQFVEAARGLAEQVLAKSGVAQNPATAPDDDLASLDAKEGDAANGAEDNGAGANESSKATGISDDVALDAITRAFLRLTARDPDRLEIQALKTLFDQERSYYARQPEAAMELLSLGDLDVTRQIPVADLAAMTTTCQVILNLDATVWKR